MLFLLVLVALCVEEREGRWREGNNERTVDFEVLEDVLQRRRRRLYGQRRGRQQLHTALYVHPVRGCSRAVQHPSSPRPRNSRHPCLSIASGLKGA